MLKRILSYEFSNTNLHLFQFGIVLLFSCIPLAIQLPFKINLFLAWEGAYRLSIGQIPFRDFSLPMGFGFWILPAAFFKLFGPHLYTLVIVQTFINIIGALSLRGILKKLGLSPSTVLLTLLVYCISFVLVNFWPWYNNSVFIFQLIATNFLLSHILEEADKKKIVYLGLASFFLVLSLFTKQDGGGLAILSASSLLLYDAIVTKKLKWLFYYVGFFALYLCLFVLPFLPYGFSYWFNHGQAPHYARTGINDILIDVFEGSQWIKFYLLVVTIILIQKFSQQNSYFRNKKEVLLALFTLSILVQAMLVQVTSYIPHNVNIYFHSIAFAFITYHWIAFTINRAWVLGSLVALIMFWWSADYWKYGQRIINRISPSKQTSNNADKISKYTWLLPDSVKPEKDLKWKLSKYKSFKNVLLPEETIQGIDSILSLAIVKKENLKVLNMSELTPLAYEIGFEPLTHQPMWFHRNVSIFDKEIDEICERVSRKEYDLVLFEEIPYLNQFYPEKVRKSLQTHYQKINSFIAPREKAGAFIEVYQRP
jgi:hypothetical protein